MRDRNDHTLKRLLLLPSLPGFQFLFNIFQSIFLHIRESSHGDHRFLIQPRLNLMWNGFLNFCWFSLFLRCFFYSFGFTFFSSPATIQMFSCFLLAFFSIIFNFLCVLAAGWHRKHSHVKTFLRRRWRCSHKLTNNENISSPKTWKTRRIIINRAKL